MFQRDRPISIILILSSFWRFCQCYTVEAPYYKGDGSRPKHGLFSRGDIFYNDTKKPVNNEYLVNTPGCYIPDYTKQFRYPYSMSKTASNVKEPCGVKAVFLYNNGNNKVTFGINDTTMRFYSNETKYSCCYSYAFKTATFPGLGTFTKLHFTKCTPFRNGTVTTLLYEIIQVTCITKQHNEIYNDAFISVRNIGQTKPHVRTGLNNTAWNVLMLGIHAMSRARLFGTMPETYKYLSDHKWLDFKGYTKVDSNTFPNMMAILTGMNSSKIYDKCDTGLYKCEDDFIWNRFNTSGYVTGYGEDYLELPDTFSRYRGFLRKPTDHYMRPFYLIGEKRHSDVLCTKMKPSATHLLSYAYNFANSYKHNQFFGIFWINSYTHGVIDNPSRLDKEMATWFQKLQKENILKKTFVIFFSDHGIRYGDMKLPVESYYDDRLPMLFVWAPYGFQRKFRQQYNNMLLNQNRLSTPFDLYVTLGDILKMAGNSNGTISEACPECTGLFRLNSLYRTCADARVSQHWCVCHTMSAVRNDAAETNHSLHVAMKYLNKLVKNIKTITCYDCKPIKLHSILRSHAFQSGSKTFHVVAFKTTHDVIFEATVSYRRDTSKVTSLRSLTGNNKKGKCVRDINDRAFCHCVLRCNTLII